MSILVTGAAGFIGYHVARKLAERGENIVGVDNLNDFYAPELKRRRLVQLSTFPNFRFVRVELGQKGALNEALGESAEFDVVIHLAAQANVRYGLENPHAYIDSNVSGHLNVLEYCRRVGVARKLVYASSSSVYGVDSHIPFRESGVTEHPTSFYAATKKAQEMMSEVYAGTFGIPQAGLRFFSVYGPWGRPDMAYWLFTEAILKGKPIRVFNRGEMHRDFTYVDDVVAGVLAVVDAPLPEGEASHRVYNIGSNRPVALMDMIALLEKIIGRRTVIEMVPGQPGELPVTYADISAMEEEFGYQPRVPLEEGLQRFVTWFRRYQSMR
jgi:UDP-glucuronate 4-epimerase